jgi:hypothetical protein
LHLLYEIETNFLNVESCRNRAEIFKHVAYAGDNLICCGSSKSGKPAVRVEVITTVTRKNEVFWDVTPCGSGKNRYFGGTYYLYLHFEKNQ